MFRVRGEVLVICTRRHSASTDSVKVGHHLRVLTNSSEAKVEKFISAAGKISIDLTIHEKNGIMIKRQLLTIYLLPLQGARGRWIKG
jgi:hypothetical protein